MVGGEINLNFAQFQKRFPIRVKVYFHKNSDKFRKMNGYTRELVELLFGKSRKTENLRQAALLILKELKANNGSLSAAELFAKVGKKKTFYKVLKPLKEVKLIRTWRDRNKKVYYRLEPKEFKGVLTNLVEKVAEELK